MFLFKEQSPSVTLASDFKRIEIIAQLFQVPQSQSVKRAVAGPLTLRSMLGARSPV